MDATDGYSDLRKKILEFHSNHYHGGKMKLVVIGG
ncbi:hypothetical protein A2U01_0095897, partial [Trifolium medium]|nr:hypothetical protein [Trifolium medium]